MHPNRICSLPLFTRWIRTIATVQRLSCGFEKSGVPRIEPGAAGLEARTLPVCYAPPAPQASGYVVRTSSSLLKLPSSIRSSPTENPSQPRVEPLTRCTSFRPMDNQPNQYHGAHDSRPRATRQCLQYYCGPAKQGFA